MTACIALACKKTIQVVIRNSNERVYRVAPFDRDATEIPPRFHRDSGFDRDFTETELIFDPNGERMCREVDRLYGLGMKKRETSEATQAVIRNSNDRLYGLDNDVAIVRTRETNAPKKAKP